LIKPIIILINHHHHLSVIDRFIRRSIARLILKLPRREMASTTAVFTDKVEADVAAARLWKAAFEDAHNFLPKASPEIVSKVEYEGGGFEAGSTRTIFVNKG
jgi:hypothetical protein